MRCKLWINSCGRFGSRAARVFPPLTRFPLTGDIAQLLARREVSSPTALPCQRKFAHARYVAREFRSSLAIGAGSVLRLVSDRRVRFSRAFWTEQSPLGWRNCFQRRSGQGRLGACVRSQRAACVRSKPENSFAMFENPRRPPNAMGQDLLLRNMLQGVLSYNCHPAKNAPSERLGDQGLLCLCGER